jgi:NADPH:quinone reductase-like Zn-dependent oxidoreductase
MRISRLDHVATPAPKPHNVGTMTAIAQDRYGPDPEDVLRLTVTDRPPVSDTQVLVRVQAASVDRGTWHIMAGLPYPIRVAGFGVRRPKFLNPGRSLAGTVEAVGAQVSGLELGEDVFGVGAGAFAEYAVTTPDKLARTPANLSYEQAAALPVSGLTAMQAVRDHAEVRSGDKVLILGASGGVGTFAVQIAKAFGAEVTGVCSTTKVALVTALGADHVIDYTAQDVTGSGRRFDVILDTGGNTRLRYLRRALTTRGRLVIVGGETDGRLLGGSGRQVRATLLSPFLRQKLGTFITSENARDLQALRELVEAGALTPAVDRTYPLEDAPAALRRLLAGRASGKVVVSIDPGTTQTLGSGSTA